MERIINFQDEIVTALSKYDTQTFREIFLNIHPMDQAAIFIALDQQQHEQIKEYLSAKEFSNVFQALDLGHQTAVAEELDDHYIAEMFDYMFADNVADFLEIQDDAYRTKILSLMTDEESTEVEELMDYDEDSAGTIMTKEYIAVTASDTSGDILKRLQKEAPDAETIYYIYVVDDQHRLQGVLSLRDLIVAGDSEIVESIMQTNFITTSVDEDQEQVAETIKKYDLIALPVITQHGLLAGIVTVDDVLDVVQIETEEDFGELGTTRGAMDHQLTMFQSAIKRGPWIILLMLFGMITANIIGAFENTLEAVVLLSAFIPLIMDSAGNTGTQALTVAVRNLALGKIGPGSIFKTLWRELGTGFLLGLACSAMLLIIIPLLYPSGDLMLAVIVGLTLIITLSLSAVVGAIIPVIIKKLKIDPAVASGPFITTINDIMGLLIYFTIATTLLSYL